MTVQRINLLTAELRPPRERFTLVNVAIVWVLCVTALGLVSLVEHLRWQRLEDEHVALQAKWTLLKEAGEQMRPGASAMDPALATQVDALRAELADRQILARRLQQTLEEGRPGFAPYLEALADHTVDGVWLRQFSLQPGLDELTFRGTALEAVRVPLFLQALSGGKAFQGRRFASVEVVARDDGLMDFEILGAVAERDSGS